MPKTTIKILPLVSNSPEDTRTLGALLGQCLQSGDLVALSGELGSGKTTFSVGVGSGWGAIETVTSPTYVMINQYQHADGHLLHHVDAYRLTGLDDAESIGLIDLLDERATLLIEWPEHIAEVLPEERLWIGIDYMSNQQRRLIVTATGTAYQQRLMTFRDATQTHLPTAL